VADLDTTDTELDKSTEHLATGDLVCRATDRALDEQAIVVRLHGAHTLNPSTAINFSDAYRDLCASEPVRCIETNTIATCTAVYLDFSGVWLEANCRIFGGDATLDRKASASDGLLCQAKLGESRACGNLDLGSDDVDTSDLLYETTEPR